MSYKKVIIRGDLSVVVIAIHAEPSENGNKFIETVYIRKLKDEHFNLSRSAATPGEIRAAKLEAWAMLKPAK